MAIVVSTITPELTLFPWQDPGGSQGDSIQPVGELVANSLDAAITLSGAGDTQEARWQVTLPNNYTYVLHDISCMIEIAATNSWPDNQWLGFLDTAGQPGALPGFRFGVGLTSPGVVIGAASVVERQVYRPTSELPHFQQLGSGVWQATFVNLTAEEPVGTFNGHARFLVYTIDQQYDVAINTPQLIR